MVAGQVAPDTFGLLTPCFSWRQAAPVKNCAGEGRERLDSALQLETIRFLSLMQEKAGQTGD
jgi:hypothetical protein